MGKLISVSSCPPNYEDSLIVEGCNEMVATDLRNIAVSYNGSGGFHLVFRNRFCAMCNGFEDIDLLMWNVSLVCRQHVFSTDTIDSLSSKCILYETPPAGLPTLRTCIIKTFETCSDDSSTNITDDVRNKCMSYLEPVRAFGDSANIYKNKYCSKCHGFANETILRCYTACFQTEWSPDIHHSHVNVVPKITTNIIAMFSFDNDRWTIGTGENMVSIPVCKYGEIFNTVSNECVKMKCPKYYRLQKSKCVYNVTLITSPEELNRSHLNIDIIISYPLMENTSLNQSTCSQQSVIDNLIANATLLSVENTKGSMTMEFGLKEDDDIDLKQIPQFLNCSSSAMLVMKNYDNVGDLYCPHGMLLNRTVTGHIFVHDVFARPLNLSTDVPTYTYVRQLKFAFSVSAKRTSLDIWYCENEEKVYDGPCLNLLRGDRVLIFVPSDC